VVALWPLGRLAGTSGELSGHQKGNQAIHGGDKILSLALLCAKAIWLLTPGNFQENDGVHRVFI
jgi:hypothetical protein